MSAGAGTKVATKQTYARRTIKSEAAAKAT